MDKFKKLNRDEMKNISGGNPPACNIDGNCSMYIDSVGLQFGRCEIYELDLKCYCFVNFGDFTYSNGPYPPDCVNVA